MVRISLSWLRGAGDTSVDSWAMLAEPVVSRIFEPGVVVQCLEKR